MKRSTEARGYVTRFGYRRVHVPGTRRQRMQHVLVWEAHYGPVPAGHVLHHINCDKLDNRVEDLQALTRVEHKRMHSGCIVRSGMWWKQCRRCRAWKPITDYYQYPGRSGVIGLCKPCCAHLAVEYKRKRRQKNAERIAGAEEAAHAEG